ncbi:MAG: SpoIIE family protein phosphatase [Flavobacteriales bacterium]
MSIIDGKTALVEYAGANNPLWIIRNGGDEVEEIKTTKQPIGSYEQTSGFIQHEIQVEKGDKLFIFIDGYADQFGGDRNKKLNRTRFKEILQVAAKLESEGLPELRSSKLEAKRRTN